MYKEEMIRDYQYHVEHVDNVLFRVQERGEIFFSEHISILNFASLVRPEEFKQKFQIHVVGKSMEEIDASINELVDWMLQKNAKQWHKVVEYIDSKGKNNQSHLIGKISTQFDYNRQALLHDIGGSAQTVALSFNRQEEVKRLSETIRAGAYQTAVMEIGAVGSSLLLPSLFDVSGILPASMLAITGLGILPFWSYRLRKEMATQIKELRGRMKETLAIHFTKQLEQGIDQISENISPYTRFVRSQMELTTSLELELKNFQKKLNSFRREVDDCFNR
eukprot:TRINITY_DN9202_c0_g1_i16.p1 TRINITY_DN9202_c0_g1~~TRINITY_DN9202_c0_g1_i16.p1  ORF type:complete len:277 (-),score=68.08 TRINITY_DN9202_c0_g1_i16:92-922(-)